MKRTRITSLVLCALFTALIAVGAFIRIPVPVLPFTLQTLFVTLSGLILGKKWGAMSCVLYMALGLIGIPIFAGGGGIGYLLKPSFGYIIGFCFGSFVTGMITEKAKVPSYKRLLAAAFAGTGVVYTIGLIYFYIISNCLTGNGIGLWPLILNCFLMTLPADIVKCIVAVPIAKRLRLRQS